MSNKMPPLFSTKFRTCFYLPDENSNVAQLPTMFKLNRASKRITLQIFHGDDENDTRHAVKQKLDWYDSNWGNITVCYSSKDDGMIDTLIQFEDIELIDLTSSCVKDEQKSRLYTHTCIFGYHTISKHAPMRQPVSHQFSQTWMDYDPTISKSLDIREKQ